jgi:glutamate/tyrosine decarboxylase-like PLP-dependent enzyme
VPDPLRELDVVEEALGLAAERATSYVRGLQRDVVVPAGAEDALRRVDGSLPEDGDGALAALTELGDLGTATATRSAGPRFFHFVMGGGTPAALGADWLASTFDQVAFAWIASPLASRLEAVALDWLKDLFELPPELGGVLTSGATMANFTGLAAARNWWGEKQGVDVEERGLAELPPLPILTSGYVHPSAVQAVGMLGVGRGNVRGFARDAAGRLDLEALEAALAELDGEPAVLIGNAGEVNAGDFDPIAAMADLAQRYGAWLHVDGAFGLFGRVTPRCAELTAGIERADSITADGHKWLNVPYDCGFAFVRQPERLGKTFAAGAPYLPRPDDPRPAFGYIAPENSRRARALAVWATLRAYGRAGYRAMVERHLDLAQRLAARVDAEPEFERLADVRLNIVCFRCHPPGMDDPEELDELNRRLGDALLRDARVFAGTTVYEGKVAFRPAIVNWRTGPEDVDLLVDVLLELARQSGRGVESVA